MGTTAIVGATSNFRPKNFFNNQALVVASEEFNGGL